MELLILILTGVYNGLFIKWNNTKRDKFRNYWHIIGWVIRLLLIIQLPFKFIPLGIFLGWSVYNVIINAILDKPMYYIGTTFLDKYLTESIQITIDAILLILSILAIIYI